MSLLAHRFVGRAEELRALEQVLAEVDQGRAAAIEVVGEAGIGKSRLLAELGARAEARRWLVLSGTASELERDVPFSVLVDALDEYLRGLDPGRFSSLTEDMQAELAHVLPSLSTLAHAGAPALQHERYRSHRAVRALLEHLAESKPLVLALDDLHWADSASVELLAALLRRPPAAEVLVALALRPRPMPERLSAALERAHRAGTLTRVELEALTAVEARELLGETVDVADANALYEESGGNPFYLEQLARSLHRAGGATHGFAISLSGIGVPSGVAASLSEELALVSDVGRRVLEGAAVAGDPFEPELAAAAAAASEIEAMDAIDELLELDLVHSTEIPRRFRFRHPLVRRAVYEATPAAWRLGAHERCADALAARGAAPSARAHHVERSAREGDLEAVALLREAAEAAARLAPASAARWFADALRLLPQSTPAEERIDLLLAQASALTATGHYAESHRALLDALLLVPDGAHALHAKVTRACVAVETNLGLHDQARTRLAGALSVLPDAGSQEAVALMIELAMNSFWRGDWEAMPDVAERAVTVARSTGDRPLIATALSALALADSMTGAAERAEADRLEAAALVDSLSNDELARRIDAAAWLAGAEFYFDRHAEAEAHAERALAVARATGQGELFLVLTQLLSAIRGARGKLAEAAELRDAGAEAARLLDNTKALVWNLSGRSDIALAAGDLRLALATAQEAVDLSSDLEPGHQSAGAALRLARVLLETGQPEPAAELLVGSAGGEDLTLIPGSGRAHALELLTSCWLALDRRQEAERAATAADTWASRVRLPLARAWADRAAAALEFQAGDPASAAKRALAAAVAADEVGAPIEAALSRTLAGRALAQAGQGERAAEELWRAAAELEACGALRYRDHAESELRKLGHRIRRRTRRGKGDGAGLESLSERELQVARLVLDSKTNPEIAAELFLSKKTVETHLRNIFRKLDVSSRIELARIVERADQSAAAPAHARE
jgi:ATP/maltotriose-dependent transcriptional regulator MalT